jgi:hypothetical protein
LPFGVKIVDVSTVTRSMITSSREETVDHIPFTKDGLTFFFA